MIKKWLICKNPTRTLKKGEKYLVELRGEKSKVLQSETNPHRVYGNIVKTNRFKTIKT